MVLLKCIWTRGLKLVITVPILMRPIPRMLTLCCLVYQIFFAAVGAAGSIRIVMRTAPSLFLFSTIQISIHLAITLGVGKLFGFQRRDLLLASNANVGGKTVATPAMLWHLCVAWL